MKKNLINIKSKYIKRFAVCALLAIGVILIFALAGCSPKQKEQFWNKFGKDKAYLRAINSRAILNAPDTVSYYIDSSVTGNYLTAVNYAISEANELTSAVTVSTTTDNYSNFKIKFANKGKFEGKLAVNNFLYDDDTGEICGSEITFNTYYLIGYSLDKLKHVVLHELGHTFGLADLTDLSLKKYSIMYEANTSYTFVEYQEFDVANITWYYGE